MDMINSMAKKILLLFGVALLVRFALSQDTEMVQLVNQGREIFIQDIDAWTYILLVHLGIGVVVVGGLILYKKVMNPHRGNDVSVGAEYEAPHNIHPSILGYVDRQGMSISLVVGGVASLVQRGYLSIDHNQEEDSFTITKLKDFVFSGSSAYLDRCIVDILFRRRDGVRSVQSSEFSESYLSRSYTQFERSLVLYLKKEKYTQQGIDLKTDSPLLTFLIFVGGITVMAAWYFDFWEVAWIVLALLAFQFFSVYGTHRSTRAGVDLQEGVNGYKQYLEMVELPRMEKEKPSDLLGSGGSEHVPYALALGIVGHELVLSKLLYKYLVLEPEKRRRSSYSIGQR